ncbi:hypothetical protein [Nostoc sp.]|uniref:hypothetical protein n=1 Tax=Nostoc sp. TaxID=1180 RepID=UPI002FFAF3DD
MHLGLDSAGDFYSELVSQLGEAIGIADGEPYTERIPGAVAILWVKFADECRSMLCDWIEAV